MTKANWASAYISIFAGSENICNRVPSIYLAERHQIESGTGYIATGSSADGDTGGTGNNSELVFAVDTGTHYLEKGAELYVAVDFPSASSTKSFVCTIYACVNGMENPDPKRIQYRTDGAFLLEGCSDLTVHGSSLDEDSNTVEISYGSETISQHVSGACALANIESVGDAKVTATGNLYSGVPRDIQVNTTMASPAFVAEQSIEIKMKDVVLAKQFARAKMNGITNQEKSYLKGRG